MSARKIIKRSSSDEELIQNSESSRPFKIFDIDPILMLKQPCLLLITMCTFYQCFAFIPSICSHKQMEYYFPTATVTLSKLTGAPSSPLAMLQIKKHLASPLSTPLVSRPSSSLSLSLPSLLGIRRQHSSEICRIGIIGGGICGVTAAHALVKRLPDHKAFEIVVLEGDPSGLEGDNDLERQKSGTDKLQSIPQWTAATARNGK